MPTTETPKPAYLRACMREIISGTWACMREIAAGAGVHGEEAARLDSLHEAVGEALELRGARANVRGEAGTRIVERVDDGERAGTGEAARGHVGRKELPCGGGVADEESRWGGRRE